MKPFGKDPRPENHKALVAKFRKVDPVDLTHESSRARISGTRGERTTSGIDGYAGEWGDRQLMHLLRRTLFGVDKRTLDQFRTYSMEAAIDLLLQPGKAPDPPVNDYNNFEDLGPDPDVAPGRTWVEAPTSESHEGLRILSLKGWLINNMLNGKPSLIEKMVFFWHNLLPVQLWEVFVGKSNYEYFVMLRDLAFGNYREMIKRLTVDPAMLLFLNGAFNNKEAPDENYARELQELFTVGKGPGAGFTEKDVAEAARVLTGWVLEWDKFEQEGRVGSQFYPDFHDTGDKEFSDFYGNRAIKGKTWIRGGDETNELLEMIFETTEVANYICRRLYNFFVYPEIDANAEENVIQPLAALFRENDYEILPVVRALLSSAHFYDEANMGVIIKNPADFLLGTLKAFNFRNPNRGDLDQSLRFHMSSLWNMAAWGMEIGDPPNVAGWPAYYQAPQFDRSWITTDTILKRAQITDSAIYWGYWISEEVHPRLDLIGFISSLEHPGDLSKMLDETFMLLLGGTPDQKTVDQIKDILLSGQQTESYWSEAWNNYQNDPSEGNLLVLTNRVNPAFQRILQLPQYQLM